MGNGTQPHLRHWRPDPGLTYGDDGSLEIVISHQEPGPGPDNWLTAPTGPFWLIMRRFCHPESPAGEYVLGRSCGARDERDRTATLLRRNRPHRHRR